MGEVVADQSAPEGVPGFVVRASTRCPSPSRASGEPAPVVPEGAVEPVLQVLGLSAEGVGVERSGHGVGELGCGVERGVRVALHLDERDRWGRQGAVGELDPVPGVLPPLVRQPSVAATLVGHESVVDTAGGEPTDGRFDGWLQLVEGVGVEGAPSPRLGDDHHEQGGGVHAAEVALRVEKGRFRLTATQLMEDLARLFLGVRVVVSALQFGQGQQDARGEQVVEWQAHPCGQQRVAAEQGHEPGRPGGDDDAVRVGDVADLEGGEIGQRLIDGEP